MKFSALNVDYNCLCFDPLGSRSPPYECIKFGYPFKTALFLLLSTNLAWIQLQIDTYLLLNITSTAVKLSGGTNIDDLERPWSPKIAGFWWIFCSSRLWHIFESELRRNYFKPMLLRVALAISYAIFTKSGTFVCKNDTVCFDLRDGAPSCWNVQLLPDSRCMSGNKPLFRTQWQ